MKLLVVEDEAALAAVIKKGLEKAQYSVDIAPDGPTGLQRAVDGNYSLILLDIMLPGMNGWSVCQALRAKRITTPILMLTARDEIEDRVQGLDMGADDYLPKPFAFPELLARVHALIRRDRIHKVRVIRIADMEIDIGMHQVRRGGQEITLTPREYALLEALASREGQTLSREMIQERVWQDDDSFSNTVDVHIGTLRKKIDAGYSKKLIHTVHGLGYRLQSHESQEAE